MYRKKKKLTATLKYECNSIWKSKASLPSFRTCSIVCNPSLPSVTEYTRLNLNGHAFFASSLKESEDKPKSTLTPLSSPPRLAFLLIKTEDSVEDLPIYSQRVFRAKPC